MAKQKEQMLWVVIAGIGVAAFYFLSAKTPISIRTAALQPVAPPLAAPQDIPVSSIISRLADSGAVGPSPIGPVSIPVKAPAIDLTTTQSPGIDTTFGDMLI